MTDILRVGGGSIAVMPLTTVQDYMNVEVEDGSLLITWDDEDDEIASVRDAIRQALEIMAAREARLERETTPIITGASAACPACRRLIGTDPLSGELLAHSRPDGELCPQTPPPIYEPRERGSEPQDERRVTAPVYTQPARES